MEKYNKDLFEEFIITSVKIKRVLNDGVGIHPSLIKGSRSTFLHHHALLFLADNPGTTVKNLAEKFLMSSAAISQLLGRLETQEFIKKVQDSSDKRITHLYVSDKGLKSIKEFKKIAFERFSKILVHIPEEDIKNMIRIQKNLLHNLEKEYKYA